MPETQQPASSAAFHAVAARFLGWTLDAFDFFVVVFLFDSLAAQFHVTEGADRRHGVLDAADASGGRADFWPAGGSLRPPHSSDRQRHFLLGDRAVCAASRPTIGVFLLLRILYGIGMGGEWGVGASLAMEATSSRWRGMLSGILQNGYAVGYLLAALAYRFAFPAWGWRPMFWLGGIPRFLRSIYSPRFRSREAWQQHRAPSTGAVLRIVGEQWKLCLYLVFLMTFMMFLSHGTQDLYPDFLRIAAARCGDRGNLLRS